MAYSSFLTSRLVAERRASAQSKIPNDPLYSAGYQDHLARMGAAYAWSRQTDCGDTSVAIIDTGIVFTDTSEFEGNLASYENDIGRNWTFSLGEFDTIRDYIRSFFDGAPGAIDHDIGAGHGTQVASMIGARGNNNLGLSGVCWNANLFPLRVLKNNLGSTLHVLAAMRFAAKQNIKVMNLSLSVTNAGSDILPPLFRREIKQHDDILYVFSSGNTGKRITGDVMENVIVTGALGTNDARGNKQVASFSNYGPQVDILAPGHYVRVLNPLWIGDDKVYWTHRPVSGTSFSAAYVSGAAALLRSQQKSLKARAVKNLIIQAAESNSHLRAYTNPKQKAGAELSLKGLIP